jgi:hypothetical protein
MLLVALVTTMLVVTLVGVTTAAGSWPVFAVVGAVFGLAVFGCAVFFVRLSWRGKA